ncbi:MAG: Fic family protein [Flavobacteriaceae bacterium]|nr:Fic family protein [Flavobacteriaceae bacterium]MCY4253324.1 Fic family protein [Flavobacteriaceae bacterium]
MNNRKIPFNNLPLLPINFNFLNQKIVDQLIRTSNSLSVLSKSLEIIPNHDVFINNLIIDECKSSSEIENIVTTHDDLYKAISLNEKTSHQVKEVLNYRSALYKGLELIKSKPLSTNVFIEIVQEINQNQSGIRNTPGTVLKNNSGKVVYTPPEGEKVIRDLLKNLENYIHAADDLHPLLKIGVIHYQFEAIHPFYDGNGRAGRILNILYLVDKGLIPSPILYLSRYILDNKTNYYNGFERIRETNDWENWTIYFLKGIRETSEQVLNRLIKINKYIEKTEIIIREALPRKLDIKHMTNILYSQPYCKPKFLIGSMIKDRRTAMKHLNTLTKLGLLRKEKISNEYLYLNLPLVSCLKSENLDFNMKTILNNI